MLYHNSGKHFIHEWAQYRYGLFEENGITGDPKYPSFYLVKQPDNETYVSFQKFKNCNELENLWRNL